MFVLTRKNEESIIIAIGGGIKITVLKCENGRVKLGIDADRSIEILRSELHESNQEAVA